MGIASIIAAVISGATTLLETLKGAGVNIGSLGDLALKDLETTQTDETNYLNGQAVPVGTISYQGKPGTIVIVMNGGSAASSLGL